MPRRSTHRGGSVEGWAGVARVRAPEDDGPRPGAEWRPGHGALARRTPSRIASSGGSSPQEASGAFGPEAPSAPWASIIF